MFRNGVELLLGPPDFRDEVGQSHGGVGKRSPSRRCQLRKAAGDVEGPSRHPHAIEAVAVVLLEGHVVLEAELAEKVVHGASFTAVPHVVKLGIETVVPSVAAEIEGVSVAAGVMVGLEHMHAAARLRHERAPKARPASPLPTMR